MTSKLARFCMAAAVALSVTALAQTNAPGASAPAANAQATPPALTGSKVAVINIEQAITYTNEGQRDLEVLYKKLEPKQSSLKASNDEIDALKKQLSAQGDKLNEETRNGLLRQIDQKQKALERSMQDYRENANAQQQEIMQRILGKMAPVMMKYVADNGFGLLLDNSKGWPDGPVIVAGDFFNITKPVVDAYNVQSGVAAPANPKPAGAAPKPATPAAKPAVPAK